MREQFRNYIVNLYCAIPTDVYEGLGSVFCFGVVVLLAFYGIKKGLRYSAGLLLVEYLFLIFCSTVIYRLHNEERGYDFHPFWSYKAIEEGRVELLSENIMNVVIFIPIGLLLGCVFRNLNWWKVFLIGLGISFLIEALQLYMKCGFAETDDVIHNTLGCLLGYGLYSIIKIWYEKISKRHVAVL